MVLYTIEKHIKVKGLVPLAFFVAHFYLKGGENMNFTVSLRHKRVKLAQKIKENLSFKDRNTLLNMQLELLKRQYAKLLDMEEEFEY